MIVKQVIRYENAPAIEATWVDENDAVIRCHAYQAQQMDELRADLGADAAQYEALIQQCVADYAPPTPTPLADLKAAKNAEINAARLAANFSTFSHAGKQIACDQLSRSDIDGTNGFVSLYGMLPPGWPGGWKAVDNTYVAISSVDDWKAFYGSMFAAGNANFAKAQGLKAQLEAATTPLQVEAIKW